jgi:hypothetical protein
VYVKKKQIVRFTLLNIVVTVDISLLQSIPLEKQQTKKDNAADVVLIVCIIKEKD